MRRPVLYILDEKGALVPLDVSNQEDVLRWGLWMEDRERCIVKRSHGNGLFISTVFLGLRSASIATRARPRGVAPGIVGGGFHISFYLDRCPLVRAWRAGERRSAPQMGPLAAPPGTSPDGSMAEIRADATGPSWRARPSALGNRRFSRNRSFERRLAMTTPPVSEPPSPGIGTRAET